MWLKYEGMRFSRRTARESAPIKGNDVMSDTEIIMRLLYAICDNLHIDYYQPFFGVKYSMYTDGEFFGSYPTYEELYKLRKHFHVMKIDIDVEISEKSKLATNYEKWYSIVSQNFAQLDYAQLTADINALEDSNNGNCTK